MAKNRLLVNQEGNTVQLSWQRGQTNPRFAPPVTFQHPFEQQALDELRWYLEEYLRFPYGLEPERAKKIEEKFQDWGKASDNLRKLGKVLEVQENWPEAVKIYIQTLVICLKHNKNWVGLDIKNIGRMFKVLGESRFAAIWHEKTGRELTTEWRSALEKSSQIQEK